MMEKTMNDIVVGMGLAYKPTAELEQFLESHDGIYLPIVGGGAERRS